MKLKADQTYDKLRGGYYTPSAVARFLTTWALAEGAQSVLEPSCGDGAFFHQVMSVDPQPEIVHGVELDPHEAQCAQAVLGEETPQRRVFTMDFLQFADLADPSSYDAVLGNPPYIRYQFLSADAQELARVLYAKHGLPFTKHLNAWAPFVIDSLDRLKPGGRLAMVIPAELLNVIHAGGLRQFLLQQCSHVLVIEPQQLIFEEALQGTVLLMAVKRHVRSSEDCALSIRHEPTHDFLGEEPSAMFTAQPFMPTAASPSKWMQALLSHEEQAAYARILGLPQMRKFHELAEVSVGIVTGANKFFLVPDSVVQEYDLHEFAHSMFGRSNHVPGIVYDRAVHEANARRGSPTNFLRFGAVPFGELPSGAQRYILEGERQGLHERYKCRIRTPWYDVPSVWSTELGLLKRSHIVPRLIVNDAGAYTTDTAYRIRARGDAVSLAGGFLNSVTALGAEMAGRSYGGGVLELVPSEIRTLPVPEVVVTREELTHLDSRLRAREPVNDLLVERSRLLLCERLGADVGDVLRLHRAWDRLMARRLRSLSCA